MSTGFVLENSDGNTFTNCSATGYITGVSMRWSSGNKFNGMAVVGPNPAVVLAYLEAALAQMPSVPEKAALQEQFVGMAKAQGTAEGTSKYASFMAIIADHVTVLTPLLPPHFWDALQSVFA